MILISAILWRFIWVYPHQIKSPKYYGIHTTQDTLILGTKIALCYWSNTGIPLGCIVSHQDTKLAQSRK